MKKNLLIVFYSYFPFIFLELLHFFIPNRAFELNDLLANIVGVVSIFFLFKLKKIFTDEKNNSCSNILLNLNEKIIASEIYGFQLLLTVTLSKF